ncbi:hypothetical protein QLX08_003835 [Tetragonisca angustula]|uniref:Reverse transcriptase domain-containing protein n=1 Tax=Tetragonisca angustula TaxID=166442 RepID=A0AAW1A6W2_9HYME
MGKPFYVFTRGKRILDFREVEEEREQKDVIQGVIPREDLIKKLKELKRSKADEIENEAWRLMPDEIGEQFVKLINKVWRGEGLPEEWRMGVIQPIFKKGQKKEVRNYHEVILLNTAYKIYASILNDKLMKKLECKLSEEQLEFRKGRRCNMYNELCSQ